MAKYVISAGTVSASSAVAFFSDDQFSQYMCANREVKVNLSKTMPDVQWLSALTSSQRDASR